MTAGRWLELGSLSAEALHGAYIGLAEAQPVDGAPLLVTATTDQGHVCLGATETPSAVDHGRCRRAGTPVLRRPLGGGTVWVDGDQQPLFLIWPGGGGSRRGEREALALEALAAVHRRFGPPAEVVGRDVWCAGRKVLGSGSATIGASWVFASALLWRFPARRFARLMAAPSPGYRRWLARELAAGMAPWTRFAPRPEPTELNRVLREALGQALTIDWQPDAPTPAEQTAMATAATEIADDAREAAETEVGANSRLPGAIKVNHRTYLVEGADVRLLLTDNRIARAATLEAENETARPRWHGCAANRTELTAAGATPEQAEAIEALVAPIQRQAGWSRTTSEPERRAEV
ncbi:MAG: hypothetical protein R6U87_04100 [Thiohalospira sp.]